MSMRVRLDDTAADPKKAHQIQIDDEIFIQKKLDGGLHIWQRSKKGDHSLLTLKKVGSSYVLETD